MGPTSWHDTQPFFMPPQDKVLLNDAWEVVLQPSQEGGDQLNATWRQLAPLQPAGEAAPAPRRGHSAVMLLHPSGPQMVGVWGMWTLVTMRI